MTTTATETIAHQDADLLQRLHSVLSDHPAGSAFRLLFAPQGVSVGADEILVQKTDPARGVIELHSCKISDLTPTDVPHPSQVVPLSDTDFVRYTQQPEATTYVKLSNPSGHGFAPRAT
ncbi:hypothetical protein STHAL_32685 [Streptomyces halstedii]|uniref:Uncharacterized protein n=1 Tax=Streptomyces halstedii TaxID=1944 RepID=A0ABS6U0Z6_STRHA|nr:hypothetical protein [Streptomyces halstedii]MBV7674207.1 hypothetical protein [Streptomyces halstedii]